MLRPLSDSERQKIHELSKTVLGSAITVHSELGPGLLESTYERCLAHELITQGIPVREQVYLPLEYKGLRLDPGYRIDLLVDESVIVEVKTVSRLMALHKAQVVSYLKLSDIRLGLLINFNVVHLKDGICRLLNHF